MPEPPEKAPDKSAKPQKLAKREQSVSLYPLTFEEAVRGLLQVKMEPDEGRKTSAREGGGKRPK